MHIFRTTNECDSIINEGKLFKSECEEVHVFKPLSNEKSGARTTVRQTLEFLSENEIKNNLKSHKHDKRGDLTFLHDHRRTNSEASVQSVMDILEQQKVSTISELPTLFDKLVYSLRSLQHAQIVKVYYSLDNISTKKFFQDALPLLKTDAGVTLMKDIINKQDISEEIMVSWFSSFSFYKNPTRGMLVVLSSFINEKAQEAALLGISSLVGTFCANNRDCQNFAEYKEIVRRFEALLGGSCKTSTVEEELKMVLVLKGIRNLGNILQAKEVLERCLQDRSNSPFIRVTVIEAVRKWELSCSFTDSGLLEILKNREEDSEVRINAYLALMTCPSEQIIANIKSLLMNEEVNQVGSFIWTHLSNLQETRSKIGGKLFVKRIIGSDSLQNKWRSDVRKFSRNIEVSHFFNEYKIGGTLEGNIIFSEKSYIPRSVMLNLTMSLFGENVNIFEIGGRTEDFENFVEELFGPNGYFKDDTLHNFLKTFSSRTKRSNNEVNFDKFESHVKINKPKGFLYLRYFGKDVRFESFSGIPLKLSKVLKNPMNLLGLTFENNRFNFEKSSLFLDGSIIVPTVAGLPLNMTAKGSRSVNLKSFTKVNLKEFLSKRKALFDAEISPSFSIILTGTMSVDAFITQTSIRSTSTLKSSTYFGGSFDVIGTRLVQLQLKIPNERIEVFDFSVDFLRYREGRYESIHSYQKLEDFELCSPETANTMFGLSGCGHASYFHGRHKGDPEWFFAGPSRFNLIFRKTDTFKGLIVKYSWMQNNASALRGVINDISLIYDTPGSVINRKTIFAVKYDDKETFFDIDIIIPALDVKLMTKFDWTERRKVFSVKLVSNQKEIFEFTKSLINFRTRIEGTFKVVWYDEEILNWMGTIHIKSGTYNVDANLNSLFHDKITLSADITKVKGVAHMELEASLKSKSLNAGLSLGMRSNKRSSSLKGDGFFKFQSFEKQTLFFSGKIFKYKNGEDQGNKINLNLKISKKPHLNTIVEWVRLYSEGHEKNSVKITFGNKSWYFEQDFKSYATIESQELLIQFNITSQNQGVNLNFCFHHTATDDDSFNKISVQLSDDLWIEIFAKQEYNIQPFHNLMEGGLSFPGRKLVGHFKITKVPSSHQEYEGEFYFQWALSEIFHTIFKVSEIGKFAGYKFSSQTQIGKRKKIEVTGILKLEASRNSSFLDLTFSGFEENINVTHEGRLFFSSNATEKLLVVDIKSEKNIFLNIHILEDLKNLKIDFIWDKGRNLASRVLVQLETKDILLLELIIINFNFKIEILTQESAANIFIGFGFKTIELRLKCLLGLDNFEMLFAFESSFLTTRIFRSHVKFNQDQPKSKLNFNSEITFQVS